MGTYDTPMRISLIDLGTNSLRLFIYELGPDGGAPQKVLKTKEMVRLGDNLFETRKLDPEARKRTIEAFKKFRGIINKHDVDAVRAIATSALRDAEDRQELLDLVKAESGLTLEVISGEEEAQLIAEGVIREHTFDEQPVLFVDIGGGSTELSVFKDNSVQHSLSLQLGAARGQQLHLKSVPPKEPAQDIDNFRSSIRATLKEQCCDFPTGPYPLAVGSSGSIRALARIFKNRKSGEGITFPRNFTADFIERIQALPREEILKVPYMEEKRADLILAATVILDEILAYFRANKILATGVSLKDGLLLKMIEQIER